MHTITLIVLIGTLIVGCLYCFRGNSFLRIFIAIYAFFLGATWMSNLLSSFGTGLETTWLWIIAIAAGIVLAVLAFAFIKLAIFLAGGLLGLAVFRFVESMNPIYFGSLQPGMVFLIGLIFFVAVGALTLAAKRVLIVIGTAVWGAYTAVLSGGILIGMLLSPTAAQNVIFRGSLAELSPYSAFAELPSTIPIVAVIILALWGMIYQFRHSRPGARRRR